MSRLLLYVVLSLPLVGAYTLLGLGISVIYQASRVLNLAHGAMAMVAAYATYQLVTRMNVPLPIGVLGGLAAGAGLGLLVERIFIRQLRGAGPTTQTVGTAATLSLSIAVIGRLYGTLPLPNVPRLLPDGALILPGGFVAWSKLGIFPLALGAAALLVALFQFTDLGLAMRGAAQNRRGAALRGVNPDLTSAMAWVLGGVLAGLAGILLAGARGLDPFSLSLGVLPAFVAALLGRLDSLPGVLIGAVIVGLVQGMVPALGAIPQIAPVVLAEGAPELALGVLALIVMASRGARLVTGEIRGDSL